MAKAALITLHGMGEHSPGYADELRVELHSRLGARARDLAFEAVYFQDLLREPEQRYWQAIKSDMRWHDLRKFMLFGLADAAGLEVDKRRRDSAYAKAQVRIAAALMRAWIAMGRTNGPMLILAHSLGGHVLSNYLWDMQRAARGEVPDCGMWRDFRNRAQEIAGHGGPLAPDEEDFLRRPNVHRIFTTGCPLPIFAALHTQPTPIAKPTPDFQWHNYYDLDDLFAWPLAGLSDEYAALVTDHATHGGGSPVQWLQKTANPVAFGSYWSDRNVLDPLTYALNALLEGYSEPVMVWPRTSNAQRPLPVK